MRCADEALYEAKRLGRDRVCVWRPPLVKAVAGLLNKRSPPPSGPAGHRLKSSATCAPAADAPPASDSDSPAASKTGES